MKSHNDIVWVVGQEIWVPASNTKDAYETGTITKVLGGGMLEVHPVGKVDSRFCETINSDMTQDHKVDDLTKLPDLHRPALLHALNSRYEKNKIYTYTGLILLAVNPFKELNLYGKKQMSPYMNSQLGDILPPHAYATAHRAFLSMLEKNGRNQSILVSGESGAGKTVTTKIVMDYLTKISQRGQNQTSGGGDICEKVLQTNPLLESLGNAMTRRNDNSSRFGKLIQIKFEEGKSRLIGASIDTYLLEKARVVRQGSGERNFHIFYELLAGATDQQKREWNTDLCEDSRLLCNEGIRRSDITDKEQFKKTLQAMDVVGLSSQERSRIFKVVMAILHLGDINFEETFINGEEGTVISSLCNESKASLCKLLEVDADKLEPSLCTRIISARGHETKKLHNLKQAEEARDALCMGLYERLFLWTVWRVNQSVQTVNFKPTGADRLKNKGGYNHMNTISCLDIFGFEVFDKNSFEQVCINYANEVLQQLFNEYVFKLEQKFYEAEGINWKVISFPDNHETISMIEGKPMGLLQLVDEECLFPGGNDATLHEKMYNNLRGRYKTFTIDDDTQREHQLFSVKHFAGLVEYHTDEFCAKNKNELRQEAIEFVRSSTDSLIKILLPPDAATASGAASAEYFSKLSREEGKKKRRNNKPDNNNNDRSRVHKTQKLQQRTVGAYFKDQLLEAMNFLRASEPHFIRCIKPNDFNIADEMDRERTIEQLSYSGVLEAIRISKAGYSSRFTHSEFGIRFRCFYKGKLKAKKKNDYKNICIAILNEAGLVQYDDWQVGHTKVFLRTEGYSKLESKKRERLYGSAAIIQKNVRIYLLKMTLYRRALERKARLNKTNVPKKTTVVQKPKSVAPRPPPRVPSRNQRQYESESESEPEEDDPDKESKANANGLDLNNLDINALLEYLSNSVQKILSSSDPDQLKKVFEEDPLLVALPVACIVFFVDPKLFTNLLMVVIVGGFGFLMLKEQQKANTLKMQQKKAKKKAKTKKKKANKKKFKITASKSKGPLADYYDADEAEEDLEELRRMKTMRQRRRRSSQYFLSGMSLKRTNSGRIVNPN
uniref:Myosin motor domain-containing protein n=1 Tax=Aplanochytrium stocchinoi TaxID=215587 RepID=A0A7S3V0U3_9STRA|mmetsp:Transcript_4053/g.5386  ORF Transcript_4053/g.5386 Transcript_4053/m.5386 type:complete len:1063 (+) Transcript_4053:119-3307(+)